MVIEKETKLNLKQNLPILNESKWKRIDTANAKLKNARGFLGAPQKQLLELLQ